MKKFEALGAGNLDKVASAILDFHATDQARMDLLQRLHADQTAKNETIMQQHDGALRTLSATVDKAEAGFNLLAARLTTAETDLATKI